MSGPGLEKATRHPFVAFLVALGALSLLTLVPSFWAVVWAVIMSFLLFEVLMSNLAKGSSGIFQFSPFGTQAQPKGHAFLIFIALVLFVTVVTSAIADVLAKSVESAWQAVLLLDVVECIALYVYMDSRYYSRPG